MNPFRINKHQYTYLLRDSLILRQSPVENSESATKAYLESRLSSISTNNLTGSAKLDSLRLPFNFSGDFNFSILTKTTATLKGSTMTSPVTIPLLL